MSELERALLVDTEPFRRRTPTPSAPTAGRGRACAPAGAGRQGRLRFPPPTGPSARTSAAWIDGTRLPLAARRRSPARRATGGPGRGDHGWHPLPEGEGLGLLFWRRRRRQPDCGVVPGAAMRRLVARLPATVVRPGPPAATSGSRSSIPGAAGLSVGGVPAAGGRASAGRAVAGGAAGGWRLAYRGRRPRVAGRRWGSGPAWPRWRWCWWARACGCIGRARASCGGRPAGQLRQPGLARAEDPADQRAHVRRVAGGPRRRPRPGRAQAPGRGGGGEPAAGAPDLQRPHLLAQREGAAAATRARVRR